MNDRTNPAESKTAQAEEALALDATMMLEAAVRSGLRATMGRLNATDILDPLEAYTLDVLRQINAAPRPPAQADGRAGLADALGRAREELSLVEWENDPPARVIELLATIDALLANNPSQSEPHADTTADDLQLQLNCMKAVHAEEKRRREALEEQHYRDSSELRKLCAARDEAQRSATSLRKALGKARGSLYAIAKIYDESDLRARALAAYEEAADVGPPPDSTETDRHAACGSLPVSDERARYAIRLLEIGDPVLEAAAAGARVTMAAGDLLRQIRAFLPSGGRPAITLEEAELPTGGFFVYDPECGHVEFYDTDADRDAAHREAINEYRRDAQHDQEWPTAVDGIVSGIVTHTTSELKVHEDGYEYEPRPVSPRGQTLTFAQQVGAIAAGSMDLADRALAAAGQWANSNTPLGEALAYRDGFIAGVLQPANHPAAPVTWDFRLISVEDGPTNWQRCISKAHADQLRRVEYKGIAEVRDLFDTPQSPAPSPAQGVLAEPHRALIDRAANICQVAEYHDTASSLRALLPNPGGNHVE